MRRCVKRDKVALSIHSSVVFSCVVLHPCVYCRVWFCTLVFIAVLTTLERTMKELLIVQFLVLYCASDKQVQTVSPTGNVGCGPETRLDNGIIYYWMNIPTGICTLVRPIVHVIVDIDLQFGNNCNILYS